MPQMDGFQLCKEVKNTNKLKEVPVILLTSLSGPQDVLRGTRIRSRLFHPKAIRPSIFDFASRLHTHECRASQKRSLESRSSTLLWRREIFHHCRKAANTRLLISTYESALQINQELSANQLELARERDLLHTLMDNIPDFIYFKDVDSKFIRINRALAVAFGIYHDTDGRGKSDSEFYDADYARKLVGR